MRRTLNTRFLLLLLGGAGALVLACHGIHTLQVRRNAGALLEQAQRAEEQGHHQQAATYLGNYLAFAPGDTEALTHYGLTLEKLTHSVPARRRALAVLEQVLRREPGRRDLRETLVRVALDLGLYLDARRHLETLLEASPNSAELERSLALCEQVAGEPARAAEWLRKAMAHAPDHIDSHVQLAYLLRSRLGEDEAAEQVMDAMLAANDQRAAAWLARARWRRDTDRLPEAGHDLTRARALAPNDDAVLLTYADWASVTGATAESEAALRQVLEKEPRAAAVHLALARLALQQGKSRQALERLQAGLQVLPGQRDLLLFQAQVQIQERDFPNAEVTLRQLEREGVAPELRRFLDAQVLLSKEHWSAALAQLEALQAQLKGASDLAFQVALARGWCHLQQGDAEGSVSAYQQAATFAPASSVAHAGLGRAYLATGQTDEALTACRRATALPGVPGLAWTELARVLIARNLRLPVAQREWAEVEATLERAQRGQAEAIDVPLLQAEMLAARQEFDAARTLLERVRADHPKQASPWCALAALAQQQGQPQAAVRLLDEAERLLGPRMELVRARLHFWARQPASVALSALDTLEKQLAAFAEQEQLHLRHEMAHVRSRLGDLTGAERLARGVAAVAPNDVASRLLLVDLYLHLGNLSALEPVLADLHRLELGKGVWWRYTEAARLLLMAGPKEPKALGQARTLLGEVARLRPSWSRVPLLEAYLDEREGNLERAVNSYQRAVELGEQRPRILYRLAVLLVERRRVAEADQTLRRLDNLANLPRDLTRLMVEIALALRDGDRAVTLARQLISAETRDYREHLWLSQVLHTAGRRDEAERVLRRQLEQSGKIPDLWIALVGQLAANQQRERATVVLQEMRERLPSEQRTLTLARCHELLGHTAQAAEQYRAALAERPDDFLVLLPVATFHLRMGAFAQAEPHLRKLLAPHVHAPPEHVAWARRQLAVGLAARSGDAAFQEALALLAGNAATLDEVRVRARVLAARPEHQAEALRLLDATLPRAPLTPSDRLLLAKLCEAADDLPRAREEWLKLVGGDLHDPTYLIEYIHALRRWGEHDEARLWMEKLKKIAPQ